MKQTGFHTESPLGDSPEEDLEKACHHLGQALRHLNSLLFIHHQDSLPLGMEELRLELEERWNHLRSLVNGNFNSHKN